VKMDSRPLLAVTMGDPAGVGPEVVVAALASRKVRAACRPLVIGDARILQAAASWAGRPFSLQVVSSATEADAHPSQLCLLHLANADPAAIPVGQVSEAAGKAAADCIVRAVQLARIGSVAGVVTAPISKQALHLAGFAYPGHTEMLAALAGILDSPLARPRQLEARVAMMLVHRNLHGGAGRTSAPLRVSHVTTHAAVRDACDLVTRERVLSVIRLTDEAVRRMGVAEPDIAVAGLNPHAGESGLFGHEEIGEIAPAIADAQRLGIHATGPFPPDSVFARHRAGEFDAVVAMLHDQGHIAVKTLSFIRGPQGHLRTGGVNVTLGLPFIRTSVDHGTAFDIAGKGVADPTSMIEALLLAAQMAKSRA